MRMRKLAGLAVLAALAGCDEPGGVVVSVQRLPAQRRVFNRRAVINHGEYLYLTGTLPIEDFYPEVWEVTFSEKITRSKYFLEQPKYALGGFYPKIPKGNDFRPVMVRRVGR